MFLSLFIYHSVYRETILKIKPVFTTAFLASESSIFAWAWHKHYITHELCTPNTLNVTNLPTLKTRDLCCCLCDQHCCFHFRPVPSKSYPRPQQPNHEVCHVILWLAGMMPFSTDKVFFSTLHFLLADTFVRKSQSLYVSFCTKRDCNNSEKVWRT